LNDNTFNLHCLSKTDPLVIETLEAVSKLETLEIDMLSRDIFDDIRVFVENNLRDNWSDYCQNLNSNKQMVKRKSTRKKKIFVISNEPNVEFENMINIPESYNEFLTFLRNLFAAENLEFWEAVNEYQNNYSSFEETKSKAIQLAQDWLGYKTENSILSFDKTENIDAIFHRLDNNDIDITILDNVLFE